MDVINFANTNTTLPIFGYLFLCVFLWLSFLIHFLFFANRTPKVLPKILILFSIIVAMGLGIQFRDWTLGIWGTVTSLGFAFGYTNALAFLKRGITFSILQNHVQPKNQRVDDKEFIDIKMRIQEMHSHGWVEEKDQILKLSQRGSKIFFLYRQITSALRIRIIG